MTSLLRQRRHLVPELLFATVLVAGCSGTTSPAGSPSETATPASTPTPNSNLLFENVDIGEGRELHLECWGAGSPTVFIEAGDTDGVESWRHIAIAIGEHTRVCAYDRAGIGRSNPATGCRQLPDLIADREALVEAAEIPGPFILVAASGGGFITSAYAARHAEEVAGMVFVDVPRAYQDPPPDLVEVIACDNPANRERRDYLRVEHDAWDSRVEIGDIPVTILSVQPDASETNPEAVINVEAQQGWLVLSPRAEQVVVTHTGHNIAGEDPDLVIETILAVLDAARAES